MSKAYGLHSTPLWGISYREIISIFIMSSVLLFAAGFFVANAQEGATAEGVAEADAQATKLVEQDESVTPEDLGVGDPTILPGNPLYVFKGVFRGFQSLVTFDPVDKAELKLRFANEKLIEAKKLEEGGASDERVKAAIESYERETTLVKQQIEELKDSGKTKQEIELVIKHTADNQIKHHKALGKIMKKREEIAPEIEVAKAQAMKHFTESMAQVVDPEVLAQKFEEAIAEQKGSSFRHFKNIEVLREVKDFVPDQAKDAIQNAIEQSSKAFEEEFRQIEEDQRKIFNKYVEKIGGNEVRHIEVFDSLGAFANIDKEMFKEIEKAREKARKRVEHRMKSIKDESRKQVFVAHLEDAELEDIRIIKELEANLDPDTITSILDIKHKMDEKIRERFENADSVGDLDNFFGEMDNLHDVQMLSVLDEMEEIIPEDKKAFWQEMKKKAMTEMNQDLEEARRLGRVEDELRMMSGFNPEDMNVLDDFEEEFGSQFTFFEDMRREQAGRIQGRFEHFREFADEAQFFPPPSFGEDGPPPGFDGGPEFGFDSTDFFEKAQQFRLRIEKDPNARNRIEQFAPSIIDHFREFEEEERGANISNERLEAVIRDAERLVQELSTKLVQLQDNTGKDAARQLYNNANSALSDIATLQSQDRLGEAFGRATSAKNLAANGIRKLEDEAFREERNEYFDERDKFREQFRDLPRDERPDPSQFLKFESEIFPDFEPHPGFDPRSIFEDRDRFEGRDEREGSGPSLDRRNDHEPVFCGQALTSARHRITGQCVTFPNTCIPDGWERVAACEFENEEIEPTFDDFQFRKFPSEFEDDNLVQPLPVDPRQIFPVPVSDHEDATTPPSPPTQNFDFPTIEFPFKEIEVFAPTPIPDEPSPFLRDNTETTQERVIHQEILPTLEEQRLLDERERFLESQKATDFITDTEVIFEPTPTIQPVIPQ